MIGICRLSYLEPRISLTVNGPITGLHGVFVLIESGNEHYRLNTQGEDGDIVRALCAWAREFAVGGWSRAASTMCFERQEDAFAFLMRWQGAEVDFPF